MAETFWAKLTGEEAALINKWKAAGAVAKRWYCFLGGCVVGAAAVEGLRLVLHF